jgi:hypothetical protein
LNNKFMILLLVFISMGISAEPINWYGVRTNHFQMNGEYQLLLINNSMTEERRYIQQGNPFECVIGAGSDNGLIWLQHFNEDAEVVLPPKSVLHLYLEHAAELRDKCGANVFYYSSKQGGQPEGSVKSNLNGTLASEVITAIPSDYEDDNVKLLVTTSLVYGKLFEITELFINKSSVDLELVIRGRSFICKDTKTVDIIPLKAYQDRGLINAKVIISPGSLFSFKLPLTLGGVTEWPISKSKVSDRFVSESVLEDCHYVADYDVVDVEGRTVKSIKIEKIFESVNLLNIGAAGNFDFDFILEK